MLSWPQVGGVEELNSPDEGWVKVLSEVILPSYHIVVRSEEDELYSRTFKQPGDHRCLVGLKLVEWGN